jgi:hypothetical protein
MANLDVLGVHPIEIDEPCFLVEVVVTGSDGPFDVGAITQADPLQPSSNWQVPYAEKLLTPDGTDVLVDLWTSEGEPGIWAGEVRLAFFMHDLSIDRPLTTPFGEVDIPAPTPCPARLQTIEYEAP